MPAASARGRQSRGAALQEEEMAKWMKEAGAHGVPVAQARRASKSKAITRNKTHTQK